MTVDDAVAAERVTAIGFHELDTRMFRRAWPDPQLRPPERGANWIARAQHLVGTDPGGCWVAEDESGMLGVVVSFVREKMWLLATYAVVPGSQGLGLGKALLAPALDHGRGALRGMFNASSDPKALRRYHAAGFSLHPQMFLRGTPDRSAIPAAEGKVREGSSGDFDLMDSVDRQTRGAAHGPDHELLMKQFRLVVSESTTGSGYAYLDDGTALLAATNRRTAARLLWEAIASSDDILIGHITPANAWAVDVGLAARLELHQEGFQALRHMEPPKPYLPHGALM
jgi:GNAT superfamily N-acetyltransferase